MLAGVGLGERLYHYPKHLSGGEIIDLMFAMNREAGTTLLQVTHDEALAARCGRTLRLAAGRLA